MSGRTILLLVVMASGMIAQTPSPDELLKRLGMEADRFAESATRWVATETLRQTTAAGSHEIVSEYGFAEGPAGIREVRRVLTADGRAVKSSGKMDSLALAMSDSDEQRVQLLKTFEKHGLRGVATDFGPVLLLFGHGNTQKFEFTSPRRVRAGNSEFAVFRFQQLDGGEALFIYEEGHPLRQKLGGEVWMRWPDGRPWRIALDSVHDVGGTPVRDITVVDYEVGPAGHLLPSGVIHRQFRNGRVQVEDRYQYTAYRLARGAAAQ